MKKFTYRIEKRPKSNSSGTATIDFYSCQVFNKTGSHKYFEPIHKTPYDALIFEVDFPYNLASEKEIEQYVAGKFPELKKL